MKSILRSTVLGLVALATVACGQKNPDACCTTAADCLKYGFDGITPCSDDLVCSPSGACIEAACHTTADCNDPGLVCDMYGQCSPTGQGSGQSKYTLTVQIAGSGAGAVTSSPTGISCTAGTCSGVFDVGTEITLTQTASTGAFLGWTTACRGTDACTVTLSTDQKVGAIFGTKGEVLWAKSLDAPSGDLEWGHGVAATYDGDVVGVGQYIGTITLDSVVLQSESTTTTSAYVVKVDGLTGKGIWGKTFPVESASSLAVDDASIYVSGTYTGIVQLGDTTLSSLGMQDVYAMKLDAQGNVKWAISVGGPGRESTVGIAVSSGSLSLVGSEQSGITIGATTTPDSGSLTGFVVTLDSSTGGIKWSRVFTGSGATASIRTVFAGAKVLVGGAAVGALDFGGGSVAPIGTSDAFVAQYDLESGALARVDRWGGSASAAAISGVGTDLAGNLIVAGTYAGTLNIGGPHSATTLAGFVANFSGATNVWFSGWSTTQTGGGVVLTPTSIGVGANDIAIAGDFCNATLYVDTTNLPGTACTVQNGLRTGFVTRMKDNGTTYVSVHSLGPVGWAESLARTSDDRVLVTGKLQTALSLDTGPVLLQSPDSLAAYLIGFAP